MANSSFSTTSSNNLEQIFMIAGDENTITYNVYNKDSSPLNLAYSTCSVLVFKYGDPENIIANLSGSIVISGSVTNQFSVSFSGSGLSGNYQQQVRVVDAHGIVHMPSQGKITIFPSPAVTP